VGNVVDSSESAVPNAQVSATNKGAGLVKTTTSDDRGFYAFRDLQEGTYLKMERCSVVSCTL
jgi:hypothetical protein